MTIENCLQGGGGLVQQLRKSYSLSDLTGEKEDENRNTERSPDEVDMDGKAKSFHSHRKSKFCKM